MDLPGGDAFIDVGDLFLTASAEMPPGEMIWTDGFTLQDAMSALEIGEPRLDSGMISEENRRPPFDPLQPLLPQELCWIIDRSFAYEMEWHAGNLLSNTVFTLSHIHDLGELDPDTIPYRTPLQNTKSRPIELLSVVLRTYILGLLKCCGVSWDALNRGSLHDGEDWQADKCEVSLLEGYQVDSALAKFDETLAWLTQTTKIPQPWKDGLHARLHMRKILLKLMHLNIFEHLPQFQALLFQARELLVYLRTHPSPLPDADSAAHFAFDPYISRRLITFIPVRVLTLPAIGQTWNALEKMLDGWYEMSLLSVSRSITTWEITGNLRLWTRTSHSAYIRTRTQTCFHDGLFVLGRHTPTWLSQTFMTETLGVSQDRVWNIIQTGWTGRSPAPLGFMERSISKLLISDVTGCWKNAPRRRRQLAKLVYDWHVLYDTVLTVLENVEVKNFEDRALVNQLPNAVLHWRLAGVREIVLSGFQLELYAAEERPFAYWYAAQIIERHLVCMDALLAILAPESHPAREIMFQRHFLTAIQLLCVTLYSVLAPRIPFDWGKMKYNFLRRYKWVMSGKYQDVVATPVAHPELVRFFTAAGEIEADKWHKPSGCCELAFEILDHLVGHAGGFAAFSSPERMQFVKTFKDTANNLKCSMEGEFDWTKMKWDPTVDPWFPRLER